MNFNMNMNMNFNTPCAPTPFGFKAPVAAPVEQWEGYLNTVPQQNNSSIQSFQAPDNDFTEMVFEKRQEEEMFSFIDEDAIPYSDEYSNRDFGENFEPSDAEFLFTDNNTPQEYFYEDERSQCVKDEAEFEQFSSMSTDNGYDARTGDHTSNSFIGDYSLLDGSFCLENELTNKAKVILQNRSEEEKNYIDQIWPFLLSSLKDAYTNYNLPLSNEMVASLLEQLLQGKQMMIGAERVVLDNLVKEEMNEIERPEEMVTVDELNTNSRKEKKAPKGNRNTSSLNHLNENYVSNIFQFAKRNYPEDKDVQKIGNERNISASNFKKMVQPKITDDIMTRKARARINGSGKELVGNIEYWMKDGYFDQCADRQKYLVNKEKALRDLALSGKY